MYNKWHHKNSTTSVPYPTHQVLVSLFTPTYVLRTPLTNILGGKFNSITRHSSDNLLLNAVHGQQRWLFFKLREGSS